MRTALYTGSFDPFTLGHLDVLRRAAPLFDRVVVAVLHNPDKRGTLPVETRLAVIRDAARECPNVEAAAFAGLAADAARACGACAIVRGLRTGADVETELQMARLNRELSGLDTLFLAASPGVVHVSASMAREIVRWGGDARAYLPPSALSALEAVYASNKGGLADGK